MKEIPEVINKKILFLHGPHLLLCRALLFLLGAALGIHVFYQIIRAPIFLGSDTHLVLFIDSHFQEIYELVKVKDKDSLHWAPLFFIS